ncbi:MaoC family dehydratase [Sphingobium sp. CCH11-B1]|uniref:MaoC family dehydratase n=1 Tax=Sphingobium sp. CCH11-B1 TaxID=1768781 RepID=UPI000835E37C|nr:MaoC family dehydratase [Sphingobium sp. CCH11-B1]MEA3388696.1 MaoC family dehydratase [Pseudomonadota bacterium]
MADDIVYFEDIAVGDRFDFGPLTVSREEVIRFAAEFDAQPFHLSDEAAAQTHFGTLAASGWHSTALFMKMFVTAMQKEPGRQAASLGAIGVDELRWLRPVRPGDTLRGTNEVIGKKASASRPEMGIVRNQVTIYNQSDKPVLTMIPIVMWRTRPI